MGNRVGRIIVPITVSDHNSVQDLDLVEELKTRINDILREEKFQDVALLGADVEL